MSRAAIRRPSVTGARPAGNPGNQRRVASQVIRAAVPALVLLALTACSAGPMGGVSDTAVGPSGRTAAGNTDLATQQACRQRVNEMYEIRNRGDIYASNPSVNAPFSANYQPGVPSGGLSNQYAYDQSLTECEHNAANGAEGPGIAPAPPPPARGR
jgi:hypothetical protein